MGARVWRRADAAGSNPAPVPTPTPTPSAAPSHENPIPPARQRSGAALQQPQQPVNDVHEGNHGQQSGPRWQSHAAANPRHAPNSQPGPSTARPVLADGTQPPPVRPHPAAGVQPATAKQHLDPAARPFVAKQPAAAIPRPHPARPHPTPAPQPNGKPQPGLKRPHPPTATAPPGQPTNAQTGQHFKKPRHQAGPDQAMGQPPGMANPAGAQIRKPHLKAPAGIQPKGPAAPAAAPTPKGPDIEAELASKEAELADLKRKLQEREAQLARQKEAEAAREAAREAVRVQQQQAAEAAQRRRAQLAKGFQSIAEVPSGPTAQAGQEGGAAGQPRVQVEAATEWDIARMLDSKSDLECLQLSLGASLAQVRSSYRALARSLHPDKCKLEGAGQAFQRLHQAYNRLSTNLAA